MVYLSYWEYSVMVYLSYCEYSIMVYLSYCEYSVMVYLSYCEYSIMVYLSYCEYSVMVYLSYWEYSVMVYLAYCEYSVMVYYVLLCVELILILLMISAKGKYCMTGDFCIISITSLTAVWCFFVPLVQFDLSDMTFVSIITYTRAAFKVIYISISHFATFWLSSVIQ